MDYIDYYYPNTCYVVEVRYAIRDVAISCVRCKDAPIEKDNSKGFTNNFLTYEAAKKYAICVSNELGFSF